MARTITDAFNGNMIAKGHDNYTGLTNIELINVDRDYFPRVHDFPLWRDGQDRVTGDGITRQDGYSSTQWISNALTYQQWWYLYTSILDGGRSGLVTIRTRRYAYPMNTTMSQYYVIANAVLTLPPPPDATRAALGYDQFVYNFTRIELLHEDKMYGEIYLAGGSTAQEDIGTTAVQLTAFAADGESDGVTASHSGDSLTCLVAGRYQAHCWLRYTGTASTIWTFAFRVDGAESNFTVPTTTNATPDPVWVAFNGILDLAANEVVTIYVESDDGTDNADITITDGAFSLVSI